MASLAITCVLPGYDTTRWPQHTADASTGDTGTGGMHHEDWRYPNVRAKAGRFGMVAELRGIHVFPTLVVVAGLIPVYVVATRAGEPLGWLDYLAFAVGSAALALETIADLQMHRFIASRSPRQVMDTGVWSWSRHPRLPARH